MGKASPAHHLIEQPTVSGANSASALTCYWLQREEAGAAMTLSRLPVFPHPEPAADDFLLFTAESHALPASLLKDVAQLSDRRPELNCFIIPLKTQALGEGLQPSASLFQQMQQQRCWPQAVFAVILRADLAERGMPLHHLQDVLWAGLLNTQSVWLLNAADDAAVTPLQDQATAFSYQQFITDYEKLTRLSHFIPERNRYRESYLRQAISQLVQQELKSEAKLSDNLRSAIMYFANDFSAQGVMEKLMLKQPDIYFSLMKMKN